MIEKNILETIKEYSLIPKKSTVTVALSGGADSVALLFALNTLKDELDITLNAAHLNHLIRGDEALRDETFVKDFCKKLGIQLFCERVDVPKFAKDNNLSLETAARQVRYNFLDRVSCDLIATAHTASDNLETILLNITRGSAVDGLCGIPIKRENIIRPLISCTRDMIEHYCEENGLNFVTDSSNLTDEYTRNMLRHSIVPILKKINPKVESSVLKTSNCIKNLSIIIKSKAENFINDNFANDKLNLVQFQKLNPEIAKKVIVEFVKRFNSEISLETCHIDEIYKICINGGKTGVPKNCYCVAKNGHLTFEDANNLKVPTYSVKIFEPKEKINNLLLNSSLDCDKIVGKLEIRTRKAGDSIRLLNRGCTKTLNKIFNELSIPTHLRDSIPIISDDDGVVWIYNIGVANRCAITKKTKKAYEIRVEEK